MSCGRCCRRQLSLPTLVGDRSWVKRRTCPAGAGAGRTPPIAPELGIERASALHVQRLACSSQQPAALPSLLLRRSPQRSAAETCADLRNTSSPLRARPHCAVRRHRSRHPPSAVPVPVPVRERLAWHLRHRLAAPSQPAPDVEAAQPPRAEKRRPRRRRIRRAPDCCSAPCRMHFS